MLLPPSPGSQPRIMAVAYILLDSPNEQFEGEIILPCTEVFVRKSMAHGGALASQLA